MYMQNSTDADSTKRYPLCFITICTISNVQSVIFYFLSRNDGINMAIKIFGNFTLENDGFPTALLISDSSILKAVDL